MSSPVHAIEFPDKHRYVNPVGNAPPYVHAIEFKDKRRYVNPVGNAPLYVHAIELPYKYRYVNPVGNAPVMVDVPVMLKCVITGIPVKVNANEAALVDDAHPNKEESSPNFNQLPFAKINRLLVPEVTFKYLVLKAPATKV